MLLENKRIIVTGGTRGIGAATVRAYVREGARVAFCGTNEALGRKMEARANAQPGVSAGHATFLCCDISRKDDVDAFFASAEEILGGLDVLAHVAGVESNCAAEELGEEELSRLFAVNVCGTVFANQAAYRIFKRNQVEGAIINFASDVALTGMRNGAAYATSKGAVLGWSRSIASEWGIESNVRCNCVNPTMKTPMYEAWLETVDPKIREMHLANLKNRYPIDGAMGDVDRDLAPVMVFLASDGSRYINGQIICVNGGATMVR